MLRHRLPRIAWARTALCCGLLGSLLILPAAAADEKADEKATEEAAAVDFKALSDELQPSGESSDVRLARQRAENAAVKLFTLPTAPVDGDGVRYRTSFYPFVHAAVARLEAGRETPRSHAAVVAEAAADLKARARLAPALAAEHLAVFRKPASGHDDAERLLYRQSSFYVGALERLAALRLFNAGGVAAVEAVREDRSRVDVLALGAVGARFAGMVGDVDHVAGAVDGLGFEPDVARAVAAVALRSLGAPEPSAAHLQALGIPADSPAAPVVGAFGAIALPFVERALAGSADGFAERFLQALREEAGSQNKIETDLAARVSKPAEVAVVLAYVLKRVGVDPQLAAR